MGVLTFPLILCTVKTATFIKAKRIFVSCELIDIFKKLVNLF